MKSLKKAAAMALAMLLTATTILPNVASIPVQAAEDDTVYVNPSRPNKQGVSFASESAYSTGITGLSGVQTVSYKGVVTTTIAGNSVKLASISEPNSERVYVAEADTHDGYLYTPLGWNVSSTEIIPFGYIDPTTNLATKTALAFRPLYSGHKYSDSNGRIAYCMQYERTAPTAGSQVEMSSDINNMTTQMAASELQKLGYVLHNGYPLNASYWNSKGISEDAQRYATQFAIYCVARNAAGNSSYLYNFLNNSETRNGTNMDVLGMVKTLVNCGESKTNVFTDPTANVSGGAVSYNNANGTFNVQFTVSSTGNAGYVFKPTGVNVSAVYYNGSPISAESDGWYHVASSSAATITVVTTSTTGIAQLNAIPGDTRTYASIWWAQGSGHTGSDGRTFQDMAVVDGRTYYNNNKYGMNRVALPTGSITLHKRDAVTGGTAQGDATLAGAQYALYNLAGEKVADFPATDASGNAVLSGIPYGDYTVKEVTAPEGYLLSSEQITADLNAASIEVTANETVQSEPVTIHKTEKGDADTVLSGAGFTFYLASAVKAANGLTDFSLTETGGIDISGLTMPAPMPVAADGSTEVFTDANGDTATAALPYGQYLVVETTRPNDYLAAEPFLVSVPNNGGTRVNVEDPAFEILLTVHKVDDEGNAIKLEGSAGATFSVLDADKNVLFENLTTNEEGTFTLPGVLRCGNYYLREVVAPAGYVKITEDIPITIKTEEVDIATGDVTYQAEITKTLNDAADGYDYSGSFSVANTPTRLQVEKTDMVEGDGAHELDGATLRITTAEDILDNNGNIYIPKDTVIDEWVSSKDVPHEIKALPPGTYTLTEITAPFGYSVAEEAEFTVTETGEIQTVIMADAPSLGTLTIHKYEKDVDTYLDKLERGEADSGIPDDPRMDQNKDQDQDQTTEDGEADGKDETIEDGTGNSSGENTGDVIDPDAGADGDQNDSSNPDADADTDTPDTSLTGGTPDLTKPIAGTELTLYYAEDVLDANGEVVHAADEVAVDQDGNPVVLVTDETGSATYTGIPIGTYNGDGSWNAYIKYYIMETKQSTGYLPSDEKVPVTFEWTEDRKDDCPEEFTFSNLAQTGRIGVVKNGEYLTGYQPVETEFGTVYRSEYTLSALPGVVFGVFEDADCTKELFRMTTAEDGIVFSEELPLGTYYVKEISAPSGFAVEDEVYKSVLTGDDTGNLYIVDVTHDIVNHPGSVTVDVWKNGRAYVSEDKGYVEKDIPLAGVYFGVYNAEPIKNMLQDEEILPADSLLAVMKTGEEGIAELVEALPEGKYYYKELQTVKGFALDQTKKEFDVKIGNAPDSLFEVNKENPFLNQAATGKLVINKTDTADKTKLAGVEYELENLTTGDKIKITTDANGQGIAEGLPIGYMKDGVWTYYEYSLKETKALSGYKLDKTKYGFKFEQQKSGDAVVTITTDLTNEKEASPVPILGITAGQFRLFAMISLAAALGLFVMIAAGTRKKKNQK